MRILNYFQLQQPSESSSIKIALNGSIDLKVTPPEEVGSPNICSNTGLVVIPPQQISQMSQISHGHHPPPSSPISGPGISPSSSEQLQGTIV